MAFSRYCVISLLQFMTSLKVIALETLFLLLMKHMLTIKAPHFSPSGTISQENLSILQDDEFCCYCFFCDDSNGTLLSCRSKNLDKHISEWEEYLRDSKLLAKLSESDMTATEAKYHKKCLTELYHRVKLKGNDEKSEKELFTILELVFIQPHTLSAYKL